MKYREKEEDKFLFDPNTHPSMQKWIPLKVKV